MIHFCLLLCTSRLHNGKPRSDTPKQRPQDKAGTRFPLPRLALPKGIQPGVRL